MTAVTSNAAVATLKVTNASLKSDPLLNLLVRVAPAHQLSVNICKSGSLSLLTNTGATETNQRNAVLRSICGMAFHNALDKHPYYLLGGHSASSKASSESALCLASISSYMSIASSIRSKDVGLDQIYQNLDDVLLTNSFLVGSTPQPTLGDFDVFFAISEVSGGNIDFDGCPNLKRWLLATAEAVKNMIQTKQSSKSSTWPDVSIPDFNFVVAEVPSVFYYGDEEGVDEIPFPATNSSTLLKKKGEDSKKINANPSSGGGKQLSDAEKAAAAEKRAKKNAEKKKQKQAKAQPAKTASKATEINASAFDIRVGKIIEVWPHEESDKLWCEKVDLGEAEPRQILSGLRKFYVKEDMQDQMVLVLCNLKKRNLVGVPSHGMVLCASNADHSAVEFVVPPEGAKIGERVTFEGYDGDAEAENKFAKKKMLEKLAPDLKTDEDGVVVWKNAKSVTSAGPCVAIKGMKGVQVS